MNIAIYLAHPSQFYVLKNIYYQLLDKGHAVYIFIKTKDILEQLLNETATPYINLYAKKKGKGFINLISSVFVKNFRFWRFLKKFDIKLVISAASDISQVSFIKGIPSIIFNDDDTSIIPKSSFFGWPFSSVILAPKVCSMGKWNYKTIKYDAYQKTAYLHPKYFTPNKLLVHQCDLNSKNIYLIRVVSFTAHHDKNIIGLNDELIRKLINTLKNNGEVIISSERELPSDIEKFRKKIKVSEMHTLLYNANLLISDSQSMCHEAALMGVPSVRYNSFVGRIGVLNDLEDKGLAIGIRPPDEEKLFQTLYTILNNQKIKSTFREKSKQLVESQIDLNEFSIWFIENYPESFRIMKENPDYQYRFK